MAEAPHNSSESESDEPRNALGESEEEDFGGFLGIVTDSWELLKRKLKIRQLFFVAFGILLLLNINFSPRLLETPTRSREEIVEANYIIYNSMIVIHLMSFLYAIYLQFCMSYPTYFGYKSSTGRGLESSSESSTDIGSSEWETEESGQYDSEHQQSSPEHQQFSHAHQQSSHAPSTVSRAAERVLEIVVAPQVEPEDQSVRPRTRSARRIAREREEQAAAAMMPPGRRYIAADITVSPEGVVRNIDIRPDQGVRTRSQSRRQAESSKPRRKPHKRS